MDVRGCPERGEIHGFGANAASVRNAIGPNAGSAGEIMLHQIAGLENGHVRAVAAVAEEGVIVMERGLYAACIAAGCQLFCGLKSALRGQP